MREKPAALMSGLNGTGCETKTDDPKKTVCMDALEDATTGFDARVFFVVVRNLFDDIRGVRCEMLSPPLAADVMS
jgi:hypothetical protein